MTYVIREYTSIYIICEGTQQKIFEIGGKAVHTLYPVDNLIGYMNEVENTYERNKNKNLNDILREVDASCAECMLVVEADNVPKLQYNQKFKEEIQLVDYSAEIKNLTTPFQISYTANGKTTIIYPSETEILLPPSNYKDVFGNFSKSANEKNDKTYEILKRFVELFGNAYTAASMLCLLNSTPSGVDSFKRFEKVCDEMLTNLEFRKETCEWFRDSLSSGKHEEKSTYGGIPLYVDYTNKIHDSFQPINDIWRYYGCFFKEGPINAIKRTDPEYRRIAHQFLAVVSSPVWLYYGWPLIKKGADLASRLYN